MKFPAHNVCINTFKMDFRRSLCHSVMFLEILIHSKNIKGNLIYLLCASKVLLLCVNLVKVAILAMSDWNANLLNPPLTPKCPPVCRKKRVGSSFSNLSISSSVAAGLSLDTRETLLQLKLKKGKQDPFDPELQEVAKAC